MYNPIQERRQEIIDNINKAFGTEPEAIEKAKWQIGEIRVDSRGIAHECYEYTSDGKPRLRRVKKNKGASTTSIDDNGGKKQVDKPEQKTEDLFKVGELKNGFKFKKNTEYVLRYNKYEKQYEVFENKTQRGAGKVPMWVCKSDNGDEKFGEKILKVVRKNYAKEGSIILFGNKIYPLSLNDDRKTELQQKKPKTLSEAQKGDTVAIVMERYNPQLGDYVVIRKGTITKKAKWGFTIDDGSGYEKTYDNDGDEKKSSNAAYGSVKYTIMTEDEMNGKIKDNEFNGARISQNYFDDKK